MISPCTVHEIHVNMNPILHLYEYLFSVMGEDFSVDPATPTLLTFASGTVINGDERCIQINIIDDDIYEEQQQFGVSIVSVSLPSAALIGTPNPITKTIQDIEGL